MTKLYEEGTESELVMLRVPTELYKRLAEKADALAGGDIEGMIILVLRRELMAERGD